MIRIYQHIMPYCSNYAWCGMKPIIYLVTPPKTYYGFTYKTVADFTNDMMQLMLIVVAIWWSDPCKCLLSSWLVLLRRRRVKRNENSSLVLFFGRPVVVRGDVVCYSGPARDSQIILYQYDHGSSIGRKAHRPRIGLPWFMPVDMDGLLVRIDNTYFLYCMLHNFGWRRATTTMRMANP